MEISATVNKPLYPTQNTGRRRVDGKGHSRSRTLSSTYCPSGLSPCIAASRVGALCTHRGRKDAYEDVGDKTEFLGHPRAVVKVWIENFDDDDEKSSYMAYGYQIDCMRLNGL